MAFQLLSFDPRLFRWSGIGRRDYKSGSGDARGMGFKGVGRWVLTSRDAVAADYELRYFEIEPAGYSSLEKHRHEHVVVVLRGRGRALVCNQVVNLSPFDALHVPALTPHRWINEGNEPFGFLCPVDRERDRPRPIDDAEWERLRANPVTSPYVF